MPRPADYCPSQAGGGLFKVGPRQLTRHFAAADRLSRAVGDIVAALALPLVAGGFALAKGRFRLFALGIGVQLIGGVLAGVIAAGSRGTDADDFLVIGSSLGGALIYLFAAFSLAQPESWYAQRFYGDEKKAQAEARYSKDESVREAAEQRITAARYSYGCRACGEAFESEAVATQHIAQFHGDAYTPPSEGVETLRG